MNVTDGYRLVRATENWYDVMLYHLGLKKQVIVRFRRGPRMFYSPELFGVETFLEQPYGILDVKGRDVVDVGAYIGDTALYFRLKGAKRIYAFEPYPYLYEIAVKNIGLNTQDNIHLFNEGVGSKDTYVVIDRHYKANAGSRLKDFASGQKIRVRSLDSVVDEFKLQNAALKMDCEGCEYDVILSSEPHTLQAFSEIIMEYHMTYEPLRTRLEAVGFETTILDSNRFPTIARSAKENLGKLGILYAYRKRATP